MKIEVTCSLQDFRMFMIQSMCRTFMDKDLYRDTEIFPERMGPNGVTYVEAQDKETKMTTGEIRFVKAREVSRVVYASKSGRTSLTWSRIEGSVGRLKGEASLNSLVNLISNRILDTSYLKPKVGQGNAAK